MKNLIIIISMVCLVSTASIAQAQETIILDPAVIEYDSPKVVTASNVADAEFTIEEERFNEFFEDPIGFVQENFDIASLKLNDQAEVKFTCTKGYLKATFDENGELVSTSQRYKDILVPADLRYQLLKEHKGWMAVSNKYTARGHGDKIDKEIYKIKLVEMNGNGVKRIKMIPGEVLDDRIADGPK